MDAFDLQATMPEGTSKETARLMLRSMLAERFDLKLHLEQRDVPMYALVAAKGGAKLKEVESTGGPLCRSRPGSYSCNRANMAQLAFVLARPGERPVIDMTGLKGVYDFDLKWIPDEIDQGRDRGMLGALDQVGLRLEPRKMPAQFVAIDHVNRKPTPN